MISTVHTYTYTLKYAEVGLSKDFEYIFEIQLVYGKM